MEIKRSLPLTAPAQHSLGDDGIGGRIEVKIMKNRVKKLMVLAILAVLVLVNPRVCFAMQEDSSSEDESFPAVLRRRWLSTSDDAPGGSSGSTAVLSSLDTSIERSIRESLQFGS